MQIFINDQEIGALSAEGSTVGEIIEALCVHVPVDHVVTGVDLDGESFLAGAEESYAQRPGRSVGRLHLTTQGPRSLACDLLAEVAGGFAVVAVKLDRTVELFRTGETCAAQRLLAELIEELQLLLVLEGRVAALQGTPSLLHAAPFERVGKRLIEAQEQGRTEDTARLLRVELRPLLSEAAERVGQELRRESDDAPPKDADCGDS